jgi:hypothetical protein
VREWEASSQAEQTGNGGGIHAKEAPSNVRLERSFGSNLPQPRRAHGRLSFSTGPGSNDDALWPLGKGLGRRMSIRLSDGGYAHNGPRACGAFTI